MHIKTFATAFVAVASLIGLSACSGSDDSAAAFNDADVSFAQDMIPHHRQATEMAKMAADRTENEQVLELASKIIAAQQPEIDTMTGWLKSWDKKVPSESDDMGGMDHGSSSSDMPGMMTKEDMSSLAAASDAEFDELFLTMMITHHTGAIDMAAEEEDKGKYNHAIDLAKKIQVDQAGEIDTMEQLLSS
ncbi:MAG: DUF305 domain-containing protein [Aeromicrobium sp.]